MAATLRKGIPVKLTHNITQRHRVNILHGKHDGQLGRKINNNKGVFQGSPISSLLYIIFVDGVMNDYKKKSSPGTQEIYTNAKSLIWKLHGRTSLSTKHDK